MLKVSYLARIPAYVSIITRSLQGRCHIFHPCRTRYLGWLPFAMATLVYVSYNLTVLGKDMKSKGLSVTPSSLPKLLETRPP